MSALSFGIQAHTSVLITRVVCKTSTDVAFDKMQYAGAVGHGAIRVSPGTHPQNRFRS